MEKIYAHVSVAYLFGSHAKKLNMQISDVDIAILLSEAPKTYLNTCEQSFITSKCSVNFVVVENFGATTTQKQNPLT
jgi:predicted nucleotidyltransferase